MKLPFHIAPLPKGYLLILPIEENRGEGPDFIFTLYIYKGQKNAAVIIAHKQELTPASIWWCQRDLLELTVKVGEVGWEHWRCLSGHPLLRAEHGDTTCIGLYGRPARIKDQIKAVRNEAVPDLEQRKQLEPDFQWWGRQTLSSLLSLSQ
ncbi:hypothetical protein J6590_055312 [Homalodisca vitripennis]|nr:hypothetical protein J6590_055312 [Homalodisca vitripennis]